VIDAAFTDRPVTLPSARLVVVPFAVTTSEVPLIEIVTDWPCASIAQALGGDGPLPGFAAGSGGGTVVPGGTVVVPELGGVADEPPPWVPDCGVGGVPAALAVPALPASVGDCVPALPFGAPGVPACGVAGVEGFVSVLGGLSAGSGVAGFDVDGVETASTGAGGSTGGIAAWSVEP
jgi:hypothetical protein